MLLPGVFVGGVAGDAGTDGAVTGDVIVPLDSLLLLLMVLSLPPLDTTTTIPAAAAAASVAASTVLFSIVMVVYYIQDGGSGTRVYAVHLHTGSIITSVVTRR